MTPIKYLEAVRGVLDHLERTQLPAIEQAADLVIHALAHGGTIHCAEIGHGGQGDFINRAGGLVAVQKFSFGLTIEDRVAKCLQDRPSPAEFDRELETVRLAVRASSLRAGDVLLVSSVSGRNRRPVELALAARDRGVRVVGFTSMEYTRRVESAHPTGKKLCDAVDVAVDIGAPYGDAAVEISGYDHRMLPVSGVAMGVAGHMIWGRVMEKMAAAGDPPSVLISQNRDGGPEFNRRNNEQFEKRGY